MTGFFPASESVSKPVLSLLPKCGACGLDKLCQSPKMPVTGRGERGVLIIAEAPGELEDSLGTQLVGPAGQVLRDVLRKYDWDLDRDCWKTNSIICHPQGNREPTNNEIDFCRPNLTRTIRDLNPRLIIPLGKIAVRSLLGPLWRDDVGTMTKWAGWRIPLQDGNRWIAPNYHPSYVMHSADDNNGAVVKLWFERHLVSALALQGRPYDVVPDYAAQVRIVMDPLEVEAWISDKLQRGGVFAFDYETDRLKPDSLDSEIVSCAICWNGVETIAYPWVGLAIGATKEFLLSEWPKIGANCKFEERWSQAILGCGVRSFVHDCVLDAHLLDNRKSITSVKYQAFVRLGISPWDEAIKPFLESVDGTANGKNRIREVELNTLLRYNGLDAVCEFFVARNQRDEYKAFAF